MIMKKILLLSITTLLLFTNCSDNDNNANIINSYIFAETQCANPWELGGWAVEEDAIPVIESYLGDLGVDVLETTIDSIGPGEACLACVCLSGRGIHVKADAIHEAVLLEEGFELE